MGFNTVSFLSKAKDVIKSTVMISFWEGSLFISRPSPHYSQIERHEALSRNQCWYQPEVSLWEGPTTLGGSQRSNLHLVCCYYRLNCGPWVGVTTWYTWPGGYYRLSKVGYLSLYLCIEYCMNYMIMTQFNTVK